MSKCSSEKDNPLYDIQLHPQKYLPAMMYTTKAIEKTGSSLNCVFPLRSQLTPKHFPLDTTTLVNLLYTEQHGKRSDILTGGNLKKKGGEVWKIFPKTDKGCFYQGQKGCDFVFNNMIMTDGVSCVIVLKRKGDEQAFKKPKTNKRKFA